MRGKFITFEGPDGAGKTTNMNVLAKHLNDRGYKVAVTREPGGTPLAEEIRKLILDTRHMDIETEALLFAAARRDHVQKKILPMLDAGYVVISDRFVDSSWAYQAVGSRMMRLVGEVHAIILEGFEPDHTLFFDIPLEESIRRLEARSAAKGDANRFDEKDIKVKGEIYDRYRRQFNLNLYRMVRIDALPPIEEVNANVIRWANSVFPYKDAP